MTALLLLALAAPPTAAVTADRAEIRLSEVALLTVTIDGDTPLRVLPPASWQPAGNAWEVTPAGPARVTDLSPSRQRWTQTLRANPLQPGVYPISLPPARVQAGQERSAAPIDLPDVTVRVVSSVEPGDRPRPPTDIELTPHPPAAPLTQHFVAVTVSVAAVVLVLIAVVRRFRRFLPDLVGDGPRPRFVRELDALDAVGADDFPARFSAAVRSYVEAVDALPASRRTPRELGPLTAASRLAPLVELVKRCDDARFSGEPLTAAARADLLADAARLA